MGPPRYPVLFFVLYNRADSVAWNPHKMLMAGIQCCALLVKDKSVSFFFYGLWALGGVKLQGLQRIYFCLYFGALGQIQVKVFGKC